ncbi:MAG: hypothetical protein ABEJ75_00160 [Candidatus Nanohaloarchaea archaeon]
MSAVGYLPVDWVMQFAVIGVVVYFLAKQWRIHQSLESEVGGAIREFSTLSVVGLFLIAVSEVMDLAVVQYHLPFVWPRLYSVIPQLGGILLIFVGLTGLLRQFEVL